MTKRLLKEFEDISPENERHPRYLKTVGQVLDLIQRLQDETDKGGLSTRIKNVGVEFAKVAMGEIPIVGGALGAADGLYAMYQAGKDDDAHSWAELEEYPILNRMDMHPTLARHLDPVTLRKVDKAYQEYLVTLSRNTLIADIANIDAFTRDWILDDTSDVLDVDLIKEYIQKIIKEDANVVSLQLNDLQQNEFKAYLKEYESISKQNPMDWRTRYFVMGKTDDDDWCFVMTELQIFDEAIHISSIQTSPAGECEGKGYASKVMQQLIDLADKHGVEMSLDPTPFGQKKLGVRDLKNWYKRVGFKPDAKYFGEWRRKPIPKGRA
jgi:ribosomal protein S18 acetylase RimI-like enzyme